MSEVKCKFAIGQLIHHRLFNYRGVVADVDAVFEGTEGWYQQAALSRPPKDQPWYHVLVDGGANTYVAAENLESDPTPSEIRHPLLKRFFASFYKGRYYTESLN